MKLSFPPTCSAQQRGVWIRRAVSDQRFTGLPGCIRIMSSSPPNIYISRQYPKLTDFLTTDGYLGVVFTKHDFQTRSKKLPEFLVTKYDRDCDPQRLLSITGVISARRLRNARGEPINKVIVLCHQDSSPPSEFDYHPFLPPCTIQPAHPSLPLCYRCYDTGHVAKYCPRATPKCGLCSGDHHTLECDVRHKATVTPPASPQSTPDSTDFPDLISDHSPPATTDPKMAHPRYLASTDFRCPRCGRGGVNAWHSDCPRKHSPPLPPSPPAPLVPSQPSPVAPLSSVPTPPHSSSSSSSPHLPTLTSCDNTTEQRIHDLEAEVRALQSTNQQVMNQLMFLVSTLISHQPQLAHLLQPSTSHLPTTISPSQSTIQSIAPSPPPILSFPPPLHCHKLSPFPAYHLPRLFPPACCSHCPYLSP